jgi:hypothetical protein
MVGSMLKQLGRVAFNGAEVALLLLVGCAAESLERNSLRRKTALGMP